MKTKLTALLSLVLATPLVAAPPVKNKQMKRDQPPPPVSVKQAQPLQPQTRVYNQQPITALPTLVSPEQAQNVIANFKTGYKNINSPKMLIYVNRDLVDRETGMKVIGRSENYITNEKNSRSSFKVDPNYKPANGQGGLTADGDITVRGNLSGNGANQIPGDRNGNTDSRVGKVTNTYYNKKAPAFILADRQTVRDVERLFGRPLRHGGATLVDQRVATDLIADLPLSEGMLRTEGMQAYKDRRALSKIADVVLEVLISSRQLTVPGVSGSRTYTVPDIQATAIRLSDSAVLGQASASDIIGKDRFAGRVVQQFDVRDIAEATALALMEDMMVGVDLTAVTPTSAP